MWFCSGPDAFVKRGRACKNSRGFETGSRRYNEAPQTTTSDSVTSTCLDGKRVHSEAE